MNVSSRNRRVNTHLKDLNSLLKRGNVGSEHVQPPKGSILTIRDVKALQRGNVDHIWVVGPQGYDRVTKLTTTHFMFKDAGDANDHPYGLFHDHNDHIYIYHKELKGVARSHTAGYIWWKVNPQLEKFIDREIRRVKNDNIH